MTKITTSSLVYSLSDYQKEDKKPIISDVMFHTMLNNEKRKKYRKRNRRKKAERKC